MQPFCGTASKRVNPALLSVRFERLSFQYLFFIYQKCFLHVEDKGILVEYTYSFLRLRFNIAHSSLITAQMGSVNSPILGPGIGCLLP